jgi:predicted metal-dependent TIM-barrel fold hydrolase
MFASIRRVETLPPNSYQESTRGTPTPESCQDGVMSPRVFRGASLLIRAGVAVGAHSMEWNEEHNCWLEIAPEEEKNED